LEKGHKYLAPYLKNAKKTEDTVIIPDEEAKRIKLELDKEKEEFEQHKKSLSELNPADEETDADDVQT
jgi:hypothetical protein